MGKVYGKLKDCIHVAYVDGNYGIALLKRHHRSSIASVKIGELMDVFGDSEVEVWSDYYHIVFFKKMSLREIIRKYGRPSKEFFLKIVASKIVDAIEKDCRHELIKKGNVMKIGKIVFTYYNYEHYDHPRILIVAIKYGDNYALLQPHVHVSLTEALKSILSGRNYITKIRTDWFPKEKRERIVREIEEWIRGFDEKLWRLYMTKMALEK